MNMILKRLIDDINNHERIIQWGIIILLNIGLAPLFISTWLVFGNPIRLLTLIIFDLILIYKETRGE